jgi:hypothetical protein
MIGSTPNPAWPLRSDAENAASAAPPVAELGSKQPTRRERAFDAAQRLVLSQPHMVIGQLEQNRLATFVLELADRFEAWMAEPWIDLRSAEDRFEAPQYARFDPSEPVDSSVDLGDEAEAFEAADPVIDAYIESDKRVIALTDEMLKEQLKMAARLTIVEDKIRHLFSPELVRGAL